MTKKIKADLIAFTALALDGKLDPKQTAQAVDFLKSGEVKPVPVELGQLWQRITSEMAGELLGQVHPYDGCTDRAVVYYYGRTHEKWPVAAAVVFLSKPLKYGGKCVLDVRLSMWPNPGGGVRLRALLLEDWQRPMLVDLPDLLRQGADMIEARTMEDWQAAAVSVQEDSEGVR